MHVKRIVALAALLALARPCLAGDEPAADDFGVKEARALIPTAAAGKITDLQLFAALGLALKPRDIHASESVPLTHALLLVPAFHAPEPKARDFHTLAASPRMAMDLYDVFLGAAAGAVSPNLVSGRRHDLPSALQDEYLTNVTCIRAGDAAHGEVAFLAPGAYEGRAEWTASRTDGRWQIDAFVLPSWGMRVHRVGDVWKADTVEEPAKPWQLSAARLATPSSELVQAGAVWDAPDDPLEIGIAADGTIWLLGREEGLEELRADLRGLARDPRSRNPDGSSRIDVVLRVAPSVPWTLAQWVMQTCVDPNVRIHRIHFAVRPEAGGEEGVIPAFLPMDRGYEPGPLGSSRVRAVLFASKGTADRGAIHAAIKAALDATPDRTVTIETPLPHVPRAGPVLEVVDLARRAGATRTEFIGSPMPFPKGGPGSPPAGPTPPGAGSVAWLRAYVVEASRGASVDVKVRVGAVIVDGTASPAQPASPLPPPPPRHVRRRGPDGATLEDPETSPPSPGIAREPRVPDGDAKPPPGGLPDSSPVPAPWRSSPFRDRAGRRSGTSAIPSDPKTDAAIERALAWLAAHQSPDGGWECEGWRTWCDGQRSSAGAGLEGAGKAIYDPGVTGLALLAFLGAGYTNRSEGPYGRVVAFGLRYLRNLQDAEGCFGRRNTGHYVYGHALAALAMVEAYGMTKSAIYKGSSQKALDFIALARNPHFAWRYGIQPGDNDTSISGWMTLVLRAAAFVNAADAADGNAPSLPLDADAFAGAGAWIDKMTDPEHGRVGYQQRGTGPARTAELVDAFPPDRSESMTAIGVLLRVLAGEDPATSGPVTKGVALLAALPPVWNPKDGSIDLYYWHEAALAMAQVGGAAADTWRAALSSALVDHQRMDGEPCDAKGSWDPIDPWGPDGGRVYSTAIAAMALEAPYRYPRVAAQPGK